MEVRTKMIPAGYKQTEIGMIPKDWSVLSFQDAFNFLSTASFSRAELTEFEEVQCLHYGDIHTKFNHFIDFKKVKINSCSIEKASGYNYIKDGDLILADASEDYAGIGKGVEVTGLRGKAISGLHTFLLRDKDNYFANGFKAL